MQGKKEVVNSNISKTLREQNKSNDLFEIMLNKLTLEEIIALKLELVARSLGTVFTGLPLIKSIKWIVTDAVLKFGLANSSSNLKTIKFLGIDSTEYYKLINEHGLKNYFKENTDVDNGGTIK